VILWRAGLRIQEALSLAEADLDHRRGALLVRHGKGGRRREVGMDAWAWEELRPWLELRVELPVGPLFCVINGPTRGRHWASAAARAELRRTAIAAGVRRRFAPHQLRHGAFRRARSRRRAADRHQRQLGHSNLGITSIYLQRIDNAEIIENRPRPPRPDDPGQHIAPALIESGSPAPLVARSGSGPVEPTGFRSSSDAVVRCGRA